MCKGLHLPSLLKSLYHWIYGNKESWWSHHNLVLQSFSVNWMEIILQKKGIKIKEVLKVLRQEVVSHFANCILKKNSWHSLLAISSNSVFTSPREREREREREIVKFTPRDFSTNYWGLVASWLQPYMEFYSCLVR